MYNYISQEYLNILTGINYTHKFFKGYRSEVVMKKSLEIIKVIDFNEIPNITFIKKMHKCELHFTWQY